MNKINLLKSACVAIPAGILTFIFLYIATTTIDLGFMAGKVTEIPYVVALAVAASVGNFTYKAFQSRNMSQEA